jgi:hypothetical protein
MKMTTDTKKKEEKKGILKNRKGSLPPLNTHFSPKKSIQFTSDTNTHSPLTPARSPGEELCSPASSTDSDPTSSSLPSSTDSDSKSSSLLSSADSYPKSSSLVRLPDSDDSLCSTPTARTDDRSDPPTPILNDSSPTNSFRANSSDSFFLPNLPLQTDFFKQRTLPENKNVSEKEKEKKKENNNENEQDFYGKVNGKT